MWKRIDAARRLQRLWIFCDGSSGPRWGRRDVTVDLGPLEARPAAAAVAHRPDGAIVDWAWKALPTMTNNEAEYAGLLLGLELARRYRPGEALFVLDSEVVVGQMAGRFAVNSPILRPWHQRACEVLRTLSVVRFFTVPRSWNRLADGLAAQAGLPWGKLLAAIEDEGDRKIK